MLDDLELNPVSAILALVGAGFAFWMVGFMNANAGFILKIVTTLLTAVACYFVSSMIANK